MSPSIGTVPATLASLILETCLTGISLVMFCAAIYVSLRKRRTPSRVASAQLNKVLFAATIALLVCVLIHWTMNIARAFDAFVYDSPNPGPMYIFGNLADPKSVVKTAIYTWEVTIADSILIYRTYIIWGRKKRVVILPILSTFGVIITGVAICILFGTQPPETQVYASTFETWILAFTSFTLCTNLYASPMIAYRIWYANRSVATSDFTATIEIILESAVIYTTTTFLTYVLYIAKSNVEVPMLDATSPVIGIVFCLITVRTELGLAFGTSLKDRRQTLFKPRITDLEGNVQSLVFDQRSQDIEHGCIIGDSGTGSLNKSPTSSLSPFSPISIHVGPIDLDNCSDSERALDQVYLPPLVPNR